MVSNLSKSGSMFPHTVPWSQSGLTGLTREFSTFCSISEVSIDIDKCMSAIRETLARRGLA